MKKLIAILALMLVPTMAFGMDVISDSELENVSGQAGVAILADDMKFFIDIDYIRWQDPDGFGTIASSPGAIGIDDFQMLININAITSVTLGTYTITQGSSLNTISNGVTAFHSVGRPLQGGTAGSYATAATAFDFRNNEYRVTAGTGTVNFKLRPMTIDIVGDGLTWAENAFGWNKFHSYTSDIPVSFVAIGLPTIEINISRLEFDVGIWDVNAAGGTGQSANDMTAGEAMGRFEMGEMNILLLDGVVYIGANTEYTDGL